MIILNPTKRRYKIYTKKNKKSFKRKKEQNITTEYIDNNNKISTVKYNENTR